MDYIALDVLVRPVVQLPLIHPGRQSGSLLSANALLDRHKVNVRTSMVSL
jgi:hypothetical protein